MDNIEDLTSTLNDLSLDNKSFKQQVEDVSSTIKLLFLEATRYKRNCLNTYK